MLHPESRALIADLGESSGPPDVEAVRAAQREWALQQERPGLEQVVDLDADGVPVRLYRPHVGAPVALYVHGGGWVLHDLETHDAFCRYLSAATGWALLAVDYRRAPEHPFPAPLDDVETVARWLRSGLTDHDVDTSFVVGIGDSSGANLVAALAVRDAAVIDGQVLLYPATDRTATLEPDDTNPALDVEAMGWFWDTYAPGVPTDHSEVSPMLATDLSALGPTLVVTAEHDVLAPQGRAFAARLADEGVAAVGLQVDGMVHSFWRQPERFRAARATVTMVGAMLQEWRTGA